MWTPHPDLADRWRALLDWLLMGAPYVEHITEGPDSPRVRLHDAEGRVWTVNDCVFHSYRHHRRALGDRLATDRVFVAADGSKRLARLGPTTDRSITADVLAEQLQRAGYMARDRYEPPPDAAGRPGG